MSTKFQRSQPRHVYQLRIELQHIQPLIWRRILVPDTTKLAKLDRIVQAAMGWTNSHLHDWHIEQQRYGIPDEQWGGSADLQDDRKFTVGAVLREHVQVFNYSYDFGDGWDHRITVEQRLPVQPGQNDWPMCVAGENACPPEDVGGPPGYMDFLEAMHNPAHEQHADYWRWWGGPFDAKAFSMNTANMAIRKLR
ncbi:plasmid pRiA4b ORF-3 family protein [Piscinibacter gummiphilus]|uniref:Plasmid pRiA4b ORF-3 family protein n=1 Tax=Piscinibacter gummiphilus TaxID=946333 RepID=A0ABZ0D2E3_9BURK|nr:plasmid pRiA4b ORF-3 family protein [Piscinibacter gummiphilus]WOB11341.1 plasmid pRiA4b ORF-3 family protein [Piscinibacter gummiphilus]